MSIPEAPYDRVRYNFFTLRKCERTATKYDLEYDQLNKKCTNIIGSDLFILRVRSFALAHDF